MRLSHHNFIKIPLILIQILIIIETFSQNCEAPCTSKIYCHGDLLHTLQTRLSDYFVEAKEFVDMPMINSELQTLQNFEEMGGLLHRVKR